MLFLIFPIFGRTWWTLATASRQAPSSGVKNKLTSSSLLEIYVISYLTWRNFYNDELMFKLASEQWSFLKLLCFTCKNLSSTQVYEIQRRPRFVCDGWRRVLRYSLANKTFVILTNSLRYHKVQQYRVTAQQFWNGMKSRGKSLT